MRCIKRRIIILMVCVAAECFQPGYVKMAKCICLLCVAPMCDISIGNAICHLPGS